MRSSEQLPLPSGWRPRSVGLFLSAACTPLLVLLVLRSAVPTLGTAAWPLGAAALAGAVLVLVGAYGIVRASWRTAGTRAFETDEKAGVTVIRYSREVVFLRIVALASTAALFGFLGVLAQDNGFVAAGVLMFAFGLAFLVWLLAWWMRGIRVGALTLGSEGIALRVNSWEQSIDWEDVLLLHAWDATQRGGLYRRLDVRARKVVGWTEPTRHEWLLGPRSTEPSLQIRCDLIDVDPVVLHYWLKFYVDTPSARGELGTPASLARAQTADFSH